ncbi:hypothetical protein A9264_02900 [Vibrio sp. UCD-FRSSP16_10]|uniref:DUF3581 family protein n=1 Tax=unclassified Vibrio TaxID=2614977 RepID=UPI0007FDB88D|nr:MULTISPECIES: DUF3581 family protein [unclassified Vibrio]OBT12103.1 hypothetical protein A9260_04350 [Vibrio sp. UCD-FRSSP16_30]OBT20434.1 hypothetical protein A9264_02900 [Vibrio sp. UCD-FRSSP16_10]
MFLSPYFESKDSKFSFTRPQASNFAKGIAGDFNPIHDEDNKRFCVPGDLLFAVLLQKEGINQSMEFTFSGMVGDNVELEINHTCEQNSSVVDSKGKQCLSLSRSGDNSTDAELIESVIRGYVQFSGMNFPHIMVPLMKEEQMMFNTKRPLIIYESMKLEFNRFDIKQPTVELSSATFDVSGKRGVVTLNFEFKGEDQVIGTGTKRMIASGLIPWVEEDMMAYVDKFNAAKGNFNQ